MLASGKYKYIRNLIHGETEELYDLDSDPDELHNLATEKTHQRRLRRMRREAVEELRRTDAGLADNLPPLRYRDKTKE